MSRIQSLMENTWFFLFYMAMHHSAFYGCQGKLPNAAREAKVVI